MTTKFPTDAAIDRMIARRLATHPTPARRAPRRLIARMGVERANEWIDRQHDDTPCCEEG